MNIRILIEIELSDTVTKYYAQEDVEFPSSDPVFYEGRIKSSGNIQTSLAEIYFGSQKMANINFSLDNTDMEFKTLRDSYEFRGKQVIIKRVDIDTDTVIETYYFIIDSLKLNLQLAEFGIMVEDLDIWKTLLPKHRITTDLFTGALDNDLGKPVPILLGGSQYKVPFLYINKNTDADFYDYLVGYGTIHQVSTVFRYLGDREWQVDPAEYTFYDGDQVFSSGTTTSTSSGHLIDSGATFTGTTSFSLEELQVGDDVHNTTDDTWTKIKTIVSDTDLELDDDIFVSGEGYEIAPHMRFAFIRFILEQVDTNGTAYQIKGNVQGLENSVGNTENDGPDQLYMLMTNTFWGLGLTCYQTSFSAVTTILSGFYMGSMAYIGNQKKAMDIRDDFLMTCRLSHLKKGVNGYELSIDEYDGTSKRSFNEYNMELKSDYKTKMTEYVKEVIVNGRYLIFYDNYYEIRSEVTGEDFGIVKEYDCPYASSEITVARICQYIRNKFKYQDRKIEFSTGEDGRDLIVGDVIDTTYEALGLDEALYQVLDIRKKANDYILLIGAYSSSIFDYDGPTL